LGVIHLIFLSVLGVNFSTYYETKVFT